MKLSKLIAFIGMFSLMSIALSGQETATEFLMDRICKCFEEVENIEGFDLDPCVEKILQSDTTKLKELLSREGDYDFNSHWQGYELGQKIFKEGLEYLIMNCDAFFHLMNTQKQSTFDSYKIELTEPEWRELEKEMETDPNLDQLWKRAGYLIAKGEFEQASKEMEEVMNQTEYFYKVYLLMGFVQESLGNYSQAIMHYEEYMKRIGDQQLKWLIYITRRLQKENSEK